MLPPFALTFLLYVAAGVAAFLLAVPPGFAAPLYPAAGVALASVLVYGDGMLAAIALGSLTVSLIHITLGPPPHGPVWNAAQFSCVLAVSSTLQAALGARLIRRFVTWPLILEESRDVLAFALASGVSCIVNAGLANLTLWALGMLPARSLPLGTAVWWLGDLLGILIATPIGLTFVGKPREAWASRRLSIGLTLSLVSLLLAVGIYQVARWHRERAIGAFDRDAASAGLLLTGQLDEPLQALKAIHSLFIASDHVTEAQMREASHDWLTSGNLLALGWSERLRRDEVREFEAGARAAGSPHYHVFDGGDGSAAPGDEVMAIRYIEPLHGPNLAVLGLNMMSGPRLRAAVDVTRSTGRPTASAGIPLPNMADVGIIISQAVYGAPEGGAVPRPQSLRGVVFATVRLNQLLQAVQDHIPSYLGLCLIDTSGDGPRRVIAGTEACESARPDRVRSRKLAYAGRDWELRVFAQTDGLPGNNDADVWLFALVGLLSTGMLGGFLLILTGRTRRIETAVLERTAALQEEVHERELAQTALRESEQRFRNILNNVPIGVIYTDLDGNVKQSNPRFGELLGYREDELLALNSRDYTHPEDLDHGILLTAKLLNGEIPMYRRHQRYVARHGAVLRVQATVTLLRDAAGEARRIVGVVEDVTEHMKLEDAERAREAAEASNRAKSEFLSRMSHELRTPLNAMLGFAQLLELDPRHPLTPTQQPWVSQIQRAGWHLLEMINDVLDLSRIESGNLRLQTEALNLVELIDASRSMVQADAERRGIMITQELGLGAGNVIGDATRVKQILTNLLSNAVKYNVDGGRVHVATRLRTDNSVMISVSDTGLGMTPEQLEHLFQPFNRLGLEKSNLQGTGIGLVVSQRLAELMGGTLHAQSVSGEGSSFILSLPFEAEPDTVRSEFDPLEGTAADYHRRIVHYVEDNETNVEVMRGILAQRPQVSLEVSITGLDGLAAIRARRPDLILLDMHLPDIDGMELLRHFKGDPQLSPIPVVVVSADALAQQIAAAHAAGCAHYLTKPVNVAQLLKVVDQLLDDMETRSG